MKQMGWIGIMVLLAMAACARPDDDPVETRHGTSLQTVASQKLRAIDSLMWQRPDSALAMLMDYLNDDGRNAARRVSTDETFDNHYTQLLISESLYKNDYAQSNRTELLQAVRYFDSLCGCGDAARHVSTDSNIAFLDARAHNINGVGYYENDSMVEACKEYLKALEVMEEQFEEKELVGKKAKFMTYTYNRLGDMFEEQMLAEPAITCYKQALHFCKIEPTSKYGIPILLYSLGIQFDISNQNDSADFYYNKALAYMPDNENVHYRDIQASKAIFAYYNWGLCSDSVIKDLKYVISLASDNDEKTTRFLTLGNILFDDMQYDSSRFYLETVFEQQEDNQSKILAAENLCKIYQIKGDSIKAHQYSSFLADYTMMEIEKKTDISKINDLFKQYLNQKQEKLSKAEQEKAVTKTMNVIIPIAVIVALTIFILAKLRGRKMLKEQQTKAERILGDTERKHRVIIAQQEEEARKALAEAEKQHKQTLLQQQAEAETLLEEKDKQLEWEKKARQREKEKLQKGLQQRDEQVSALEKALNEQREEAELRREAFMKEAICCKINDSIRGQRITARNSHEKYVGFNEEDAAALKAAVLRHYEDFESVLLSKYPKLSQDDLQLCQLYLIGLDERQIAVLQNKSYSAIKKRASTLKKLLGLDENLQAFLLKFFSFQEK